MVNCPISCAMTFLPKPAKTANIQSMSTEFEYDVFLSHGTEDKIVVRQLAERLRQDGLNVWFDEWLIKLDDSIPVKIEDCLEHLRIMLLYAFGLNWAQFRASTCGRGNLSFRDPHNQARRFIFRWLHDLPPPAHRDYSRSTETRQLRALPSRQSGERRHPLGGFGHSAVLCK